MMGHGVKLPDLLKGLHEGPVPNLVVKDLNLDNRKVTPEGLFVALKGEKIDARTLIAATLKKGVKAVVYDDFGTFEIEESIKSQDNVIAIKQLPEKLSELAARFYDYPSKKLTVVGITGTNGKTTIAYLLAQLLAGLGDQVSFLGTLGVGILGDFKATGMTTPDAIKTQKLMAQMKAQGVRTVCMEVSSHALSLGRVSAVDFDVVVFSNLSQDHLDFHHTEQAYKAAKQKLFDQNPQASSVINADDRFGKTLMSANNLKIITYGIEAGDLRALSCQTHPYGLSFTLQYGEQTCQIISPLVGQFNVNNLLAVVGVSLQLGYKLDDVVAGLADCKVARGRMERIGSTNDTPVVIVDYAHTPDALEQSLLACKAHCEGMVIVVFGCGGDRDKAKRAKMGQIAQRLADCVYITDDNPRSENPATIVSDIRQNLDKPVQVIHDRKHAIETAIAQSGRKDWILIAGKGHETQQIFKDKIVNFDDRKISQACLERLRA